MSWDEPATGRQCRRVALQCMALGIRDEPESRPMTRAETRDLIHELRGKLVRRRNVLAKG